MWAKMLRPACAILMMCCCCFVLIYKSQCIMFTAVVGCAYDSKSSSGPTAVHRECVYLCWSPADLLCCSSDWLSGVLLSQLGFRLVDCLHRLLGRALLLAHGQENRERERDGESRRVEKNSAKIESKERKDKEEWRGMEGERKQEKKKKWNISLNESLLAVSVSQPGGVGVLPQALHCSSLSIPPSPPLFCLCVCL